jgi:hypothetical protein
VDWYSKVIAGLIKNDQQMLGLVQQGNLWVNEEQSATGGLVQQCNQ